MALAIWASHPEITLNTEKSVASQSAALFTSLPTIIKCWSINALFELVDLAMIC